MNCESKETALATERDLFGDVEDNFVTRGVGTHDPPRLLDNEVRTTVGCGHQQHRLVESTIDLDKDQLQLTERNRRRG